jgi:anti-sigma factor RsiW
MKCEDLLKTLNDYVDGQIDPAVCDEFEQHLAGCNPCQIVVDNIRRTITLYQVGEPYEIPTAFRDRLRRTLQEKWSARGGNR